MVRRIGNLMEIEFRPIGFLYDESTALSSQGRDHEAGSLSPTNVEPKLSCTCRRTARKPYSQ